MKNLVGAKFGILTVVARAEDHPYRARFQWLCRCDCGKEIVVIGENLKQGNTKSCGCLKTTHSMSKSDEYRIWAGMWSRCTNPKDDGYRNYGGRGISVHPSWSDFSVFYRDVGARPSPAHSIDRKDVNSNYEPGNIRWATMIEQGNNRRHNKILTLDGVSRTQAEWARHLSISRVCIALRIKRKLPMEQALYSGKYVRQPRPR